jgi:hypothetical protein
MSDLVMLASLLGFIALTRGLLALCDWLMGGFHERS